MIELGDLREGILPGGLVAFYQSVFQLPHIEVLGIGTNLGCLAGVPPSADQLMQLVLYRELLELKFTKSPFHSFPRGRAPCWPLLLEGQVPRGGEPFRVGEALFLGTDLLHGGALPGIPRRRDPAGGGDCGTEGEGAGGAGRGRRDLAFPGNGGDRHSSGPAGGSARWWDMGQLDTDIAGSRRRARTARSWGPAATFPW
jgi:hypothetical protein